MFVSLLPYYINPVLYTEESQLRGAFTIYCNCHRNSHAMHEIPMKSNKGNSTIFYLSMDTSIVPIGALVFVLHALEMSSFI